MTILFSLFIAAAIIGVLVGTRFNVFLLVPLVTIGLAAILGIGFARAGDPWVILLTAFGTITAMQMGYFAVTLIGYVAAKVRVRKNAAEITVIPPRLSRHSRA